jgi:hypothetical protein
MAIILRVIRIMVGSVTDDGQIETGHSSDHVRTGAQIRSGWATKRSRPLPNWSSGGTADSLVVARLARSNESAARFLTNPVISAERPVLWRRQTKSSSYAGLSRTGGLFARGFAA